MLLLESARDDLDIHADPATIWAHWVDGPVNHHIIDSGHHRAEEALEEAPEAIRHHLDHAPKPNDDLHPAG